MNHDGPNESQPELPWKVPVAWAALEDAFENNAPEVHSYLHLETGEVIRIVDGIADPAMHQRVARDPHYLRVDPVSSREQYRWMERFIATVEDSELRDQLVRAIDGKGAFRRFKDVLMSFPVDRERWFTFRSERLRAGMEAWLRAHGIEVRPRDEWRVPSADEVKPMVPTQTVERPARRSRAVMAEAQRRRLHEVADLLAARELDTALAFLEFLRDRRHIPRPRARPSARPDEVEEGQGVEHLEVEEDDDLEQSDSRMLSDRPAGTDGDV